MSLLFTGTGSGSGRHRFSTQNGMKPAPKSAQERCVFQLPIKNVEALTQVPRIQPAPNLLPPIKNSAQDPTSTKPVLKENIQSEVLKENIQSDPLIKKVVLKKKEPEFETDKIQPTLTEDSTDDSMASSGEPSDVVAPASTLDGRLKYIQILSTIDKIKSAIGIDEISGEGQDVKIQLPRVIVIGDESAGKSSTLERIAMAGVLPRSRNICTRQPIVLKLRKDQIYAYDQPMLKLNIPGKDEVSGLQSHQVRTLLEDHMQMIAEDGRGMVIDEEIEVEVRSAGVPDIDLVDLPGLVAVKASDSTDLRDLSESCTHSYLHKESTGAVVCVIDAGMPNLRSSNAIKLLQQAPEIRIIPLVFSPKLIKLRIGTGLIPKIQKETSNRVLSGSSRNEFKAVILTLSELNCTLGSVFNRDTDSRRKKLQTLEEHNLEELKWKKENFDKSDSFVKSRIGLDNLIGFMDKVICTYLSQKWVPAKLAELETRRLEIVAKIDALGLPPEALSVDQLHVEAEQLMTKIIPERACSAVEKVLRNLLPMPINYDTTCTYNHALKCLKFETKVKAAILQPAFLKVFVSQLQRIVHEIFDADTVGPIQLGRFPAVRDAYGNVLTRVVEEQTFVDATKNVIDFHFAGCCFDKGLYLDRERLVVGLHCCILQHLVVGVSDLKKTTELAREMIKAVPNESCADTRQKYTVCLDQINKIKSLYESILSSDDEIL